MLCHNSRWLSHYLLARYGASRIALLSPALGTTVGLYSKPPTPLLVVTVASRKAYAQSKEVLTRGLQVYAKMNSSAGSWLSPNWPSPGKEPVTNAAGGHTSNVYARLSPRYGVLFPHWTKHWFRNTKRNEFGVPRGFAHRNDAQIGQDTGPKRDWIARIFIHTAR